MGETAGIDRCAELVNKLFGKSNEERVTYLRSIKLKEINLLSEICLNVVKGNLQLPKRAKTVLARVKKTLYKLASRVIHSDAKKKLWKTLKGLHILNILLPILKNEIFLPR